MTTAASSRRLPDVALQFGAAAFACLAVPDVSVGTVVVLAPSGRPSRRAEDLASRMNGQQLSTLTLSLPLQASPPMAATALVDLTGRLAALLGWMNSESELRAAPVGCLGIGPAAAIVLRVAEAEPRLVDAVVSVSGWTDAAEAQMPLVEAPTLLIEGAANRTGQERAWQALHGLGGDADVQTVTGARDPMATPAAREQVAHLASTWFHRVFAGAASSPNWRLAHDGRSTVDPGHSLFV